MDEEKRQRQMDFILEQQAQFAAQIGRLEDTTKQIGENVVRLGGVVEHLGGIVERLVNTVERLGGVVERLAQVMAERFEAVDRRADETDRKIAALVDAQIRNEEMVTKLGERIDNLTAVVERHTADGHGGKGQPDS